MSNNTYHIQHILINLLTFNIIYVNLKSCIMFLKFGNYFECMSKTGLILKNNCFLLGGKKQC